MDKYLAQEFKSIKRPFSRIEAMFSYTLDVNNGNEGSIIGYSKLWQWSRNKVRKFITDIKSEKGHIKDSKRTAKGQPIHFIDTALRSKKDNKRTAKGQQRDTTTKKELSKDNSKEIYSEVAKRLILKINALSGKNFRIIQTNIDFIVPRLKEGFTESDCETVIENKFKDPNFSMQYFKPETLFRPTKFEGYLNENYQKGGGCGTENQKNGQSGNYTQSDTRPPVIPENIPDYTKI